MQYQSRPQYRINYRFCNQPLHSDQKTNLICLSPDCQDHPLICSLCLQLKHSGHKTKPLKHFLSQLEKHYAQSRDTTVNQELEQLENDKFYWLTKIKNIVDNLAHAFMMLEQQVIHKYEHIKSQILQRQAKRSRFNTFYQSMATMGKGDPNFQIQNYLHFEPFEVFNQPQSIDHLNQSWYKTVQQLREKLIVLKKDSIFTENTGNHVQKVIASQPKNNMFIMPLSIKRIGNNFLQTSPNSKQTLGHLDVLLKNWTGKLKIKINSMQPNSKFALGVAKLTDIITSKTVEQLKKKPSVFYFDSTGVTQLQEYNHIPFLKAGEYVYVFVKKSNLKIVHQKNMMCCHHLKNKQDTVVYLSIEGNCELEMVYPFIKGA